MLTDERTTPIYVPEWIHREIKAKAASHGKTMQTVAAELLELALAFEAKNGKGAAK